MSIPSSFHSLSPPPSLHSSIFLLHVAPSCELQSQFVRSRSFDPHCSFQSSPSFLHPAQCSSVQTILPANSSEFRFSANMDRTCTKPLCASPFCASSSAPCVVYFFASLPLSSVFYTFPSPPPDGAARPPLPTGARVHTHTSSLPSLPTLAPSISPPSFVPVTVRYGMCLLCFFSPTSQPTNQPKHFPYS
jgi:hypothetical protein